ncbi:MAG: transcriptional repressor [Deltaproteobacteria bacterium]|nr:transcriptional repressor [Deltaproteobacteria bacterium]
MKQTFAQHVRKHGLKSTRQRDRIVDVFLRSSGHVSIDDLVEQVHRVDPRISSATVYRTVKLLADAGLADKRQFVDGLAARYEPTGAEHHDHLICTRCGRIDEFENEAIERLQEEVARSHGYRILSHRHEIRGLCPACRENF